MSKFEFFGQVYKVVDNGYVGREQALAFCRTRPLPAFGRQGLDADTRDDSPRACGARLGGGIEWGAPTDLLSN